MTHTELAELATTPAITTAALLAWGEKENSK